MGRDVEAIVDLRACQGTPSACAHMMQRRLQTLLGANSSHAGCDCHVSAWLARSAITL